MEGPLSVWTNWITRWHYCWVVLDERLGSLYRFKSHAKRKAGVSFLTKLSGINLLGAIVTRDPEDPCGFSVTSEGKEYRFQAPNAKNREAWVVELEETVLRQMVCHRAYHMWDRRYIGPTLALVNAKLQDASFLYDELACCAKELDGRVFVLTSESERAQLSIVLCDVIAFLSSVKAVVNLLMQLKEMILPDFIAQLDTLPPRKKAVTILSFLRKQADPLSVLGSCQPSSASSFERAPSSSRATRSSAPLTLSVGRQPAQPFGSAFGAHSRHVASEEYSTLSTSASTTSAAHYFSAPTTATTARSHQSHKEPSEKKESSATKISKLLLSVSEDRSALTPQPVLHEIDGESAATAGGATDSVGRGSFESLRALCRSTRYGMSMLKVNYPVRLLQPESLLESLARIFASPQLFASIPLRSKPSDRMLEVVRWYLSAVFNAKQDDDIVKPYSPVLGELFRCIWSFDYKEVTNGKKEVTLSGPIPDARENDLTFVAEQVSANPPVSCMYCEHPMSGMSFVGHIMPQAYYVGTYVQLHVAGQGCISVLPYSEEYVLGFPSGCIRAVDTARPWFEFCGNVTISCARTGYHANIKFLAKPPRADSKKHGVLVEVFNPMFKKPFIRMQGCWNGLIDAHWASGEIEPFLDAEVLGERRRQPQHYIVGGTEEILDSRWIWRTVTVSLQVHNFKEAKKHKQEIESASYEAHRNHYKKGAVHMPTMFQKVSDHYLFKGCLKARMELLQD